MIALNLVSASYELTSKAAGQLPTGFNPKDFTLSLSPKGLQMAIPWRQRCYQIDWHFLG